MSNRLSKGVIVAGKLSQDKPGFPQMGPAVRISNPGSTAETTSGFVFGASDVLESFIVKVTSVTATSGTLSLGLLSSSPSGFVSALPVGSTGVKSVMFTVSTSGATGSEYIVSASYIGTLLGRVNTGTTTGASGSVLFTPYALDSTTVKTLSYSYSSTAAFAASVYPVFYTLNS